MKTPAFSGHAHSKGVWFRIFGYGLYFDIDSTPLFSERYGHRKVLRIGRLAMGMLKP